MDKKISSIKVLKKNYNQLTENKLEEIKKDFDLVIRSVRLPLKNDMTYFDCASSMKDIEKDKRIIYFHGVQIRLSKTQFAVLYILLKESELLEIEYKKIVDTINRTNRKDVLSNNLKSFVSSFKEKIISAIEKDKIKESSYFHNLSDEDIINEFNKLIYYKKNANSYVLFSNYSI